MSKASIPCGLDLRDTDPKKLDLDRLAGEYAQLIRAQLAQHNEDPDRVDWRRFATRLYVLSYFAIDRIDPIQLANEIGDYPDRFLGEAIPAISGKLDVWVARAMYVLAFRVPETRILTRYNITTARQGREIDVSKRNHWVKLIKAEYGADVSLSQACRAAIAKNTTRRDSKSPPSVATLRRYWREQFDIPSSPYQDALKKAELARQKFEKWTPKVEEIARRAVAIVQKEAKERSGEIIVRTVIDDKMIFPVSNR